MLAAPATALGKSRPVAEDRTIEGHWALRSHTTLQRPKTLTSLWISKPEADAFVKTRDTPPPASVDPVGQATTEWIERGPLAETDGRYMTSWVVDPPDGRLPYSDNGRRLMEALEKQFEENMDNPESRDAAERCLGGTVGPPLIDVGYGGHIQILCTRDHVAIRSEEGFAPRIIPLSPSDAPVIPRTWVGASRARFDGPDLIVETSSFHPDYLLRFDFYLSPDAKVSERFTRAGKNELRYFFTVEDPTVYTQTWRAMMIFRASDAPIFDFACHEGNYSLPNILAGAREKEKAAASPARAAASPP